MYPVGVYGCFSFNFNFLASFKGPLNRNIIAANKFIKSYFRSPKLTADNRARNQLKLCPHAELCVCEGTDRR